MSVAPKDNQHCLICSGRVGVSTRTSLPIFAKEVRAFVVKVHQISNNLFQDANMFRKATNFYNVGCNRTRNKGR